MFRPSLLVLFLTGACASAHTVTPLAIATRPCAPAPTLDTVIYDLSQVSPPPQLLHTVTLSVPPDLLRRSVRLHVLLSLIVDSEGAVDSSRVSLVQRSGTSFDEYAVHAAGQMVFAPACRDGYPVRSRVLFPMDYESHG